MACQYHINIHALQLLGLWEPGVIYEPKEMVLYDAIKQNPHLIMLNALKEFYSAPYISTITYSAMQNRVQPTIFYTSPSYEVEAKYKEFKKKTLSKIEYLSRVLRGSTFRLSRLEMCNSQWKVMEREAEHERVELRGSGSELEFLLGRLAMRMDDAAELYYKVYFQQRRIPAYFGKNFVNRKIRCIRNQHGRLLPHCYMEKSIRNFTERYTKYGVNKSDTAPPMTWNERYRLMLGQNCCVMKSSIHGHGLFALTYIPKGRNVIEYVGEIVNKEQANVRERRLSAQGFTSTYMFSISPTQEIIVDATFIGNAARFANHSCLPNCEVHVVENRLYLRALEEISPGDELCYDYNLRQNEGDTRLQCFCNAPNCRGFMDQ